MDRRTTLMQLERTRDQTLPFFAADATEAARAYAPGKWTLRQVLLHLADHESLTLDRLRRCLSEDNPHLPNYDTDAWAAVGSYARRDLAAARDLYHGARAAIIETLRLMPAGADARPAVHATLGPTTTLGIAGTWMHNQHHLAQLTAIRAGRMWTADG